MTITTNQTLEVRNLLSFRKMVTGVELNELSQRMLGYIESTGAQKIGGGISATYAIDGDKLDIAMYIPIDREVLSTEEFEFKPLLQLENCVVATHKGNPQLLENTLQGLNDYITQNGLTSISVGFIVTKREITDMKDAEHFEVDVYISISPNVV